MSDSDENDAPDGQMENGHVPYEATDQPTERSPRSRSNSDQFDLDLPTSHRYLGKLDNITGYTFFDDGEIITLAALQTNTLVFPGFTLPLVMDSDIEVSILQRFTSKKNAFVLLTPNTSEDDPYFTESGSDYTPMPYEETDDTDESVTEKSGRVVTKLPSVPAVTKLPSVPAVRKKLFSNDSPSSRATEKVDATLLIASDKVTLSIPGMLHKGLYRTSVHNANEMKSSRISFVISESRPANSHACVFHKPGEVPCFVRVVDEDVAEITVVRCLSDGELQGVLSDVTEFRIAPLLYTKGESTTTSDNVRMKRHYCHFCRKLRTAISRHFLTQHVEEPSVIEISKLPPKSTTRIQKLNELRIKGDNTYNETVPRWKRIPKKQPSRTSVEEMVLCKCGALLSKKYFSQHERKCSGRSNNMKRVLPLAKSRELENQNDNGGMTAEEFLVSKMLLPLHKDEISEEIRNDRCLMLLAKMYAVKNRGVSYRNRNARQHLRIAARLIQRVKKYDDSVKEWIDALKPTKYKVIIKAIDEELSYNSTTETYETPSLGNIVRLVIINLIDVVQVDLSMSGVNSKHPMCMDLKELNLVHRKHFSTVVGKTAYLSTKTNQLNKETKLPSLEDVVKFTKYVNDNAEKAFSELKENGFNHKYWYQLNCAVLLQIVLFNRRRPGEASRIHLSSFEKRDAITPKDYKYMNRLEILLAKQFVRVQTLGKRFRKLAVLLKLRQVEYINMLISMRKDAGIGNENPYLFASNTAEGYFQVNVIIRKWADRAGLAQPELLRCTLLRKQVATMAQYMNLSNADLRLVAEGMGHDLSVHLQNYRQPEINTQITKLSRFFMAVGDTDISKFKGKSLAELEALEVDDDDDDVELGKGNTALNNLRARHLTEEAEDSDHPHTDASFVRTPPRTLRYGTSAMDRRNHSLTPRGAEMTPRSRALHYSETTVVVVSPLQSTGSRCVIDVSRRNHEEMYKAKTTGKLSLRKKRQTWTSEQQSLMLDFFKGKLMKKSYPKLNQVEEFVQSFQHVFKGRTARHVYSWLQYRIKN